MKNFLNIVNRTLIAFAIFSFAFASIAVAQVAGTSTPENGPDLITILNEALGAFGTFKSGGVLLGLLATVNVLTNATKLPFIDNLLKSKFWLRPLIAVVLGLATGLLSSLVSGASIPASIVAGIIAALGSTGFHEVITAFNGRVQNERAVGAKIVELISGSDVKAKTAVAPIQAEIEKIAAIPVEKDRLAALAAWANTHTPV